MRVLCLGAGGVGTSAALIAARRTYFGAWVIADYDLGRSLQLADRVGDPRFTWGCKLMLLMKLKLFD